MTSLLPTSSMMTSSLLPNTSMMTSPLLPTSYCPTNTSLSSVLQGDISLCLLGQQQHSLCHSLYVR